MATAQVEISQSQLAALEQLARDTGRTQDELLREAVDRLLEEAGVDAIDWRALLRSGEGLWEYREDLPDFDEIRRELDRDLWSK